MVMMESRFLARAKGKVAHMDHTLGWVIRWDVE